MSLTGFYWKFRSEADDLARSDAVYGDKLSRCAGWRLVLPAAKTCPHCGSVTWKTDCRAPGMSRAERAAEMIRG